MKLLLVLSSLMAASAMARVSDDYDNSLDSDIFQNDMEDADYSGDALGEIPSRGDGVPIENSYDRVPDRPGYNKPSTYAKGDTPPLKPPCKEGKKDVKSPYVAPPPPPPSSPPPNKPPCDEGKKDAKSPDAALPPPPPPSPSPSPSKPPCKDERKAVDSPTLPAPSPPPPAPPSPITVTLTEIKTCTETKTVTSSTTTTCTKTVTAPSSDQTGAAEPAQLPSPTDGYPVAPRASGVAPSKVPSNTKASPTSPENSSPSYAMRPASSSNSPLVPTTSSLPGGNEVKAPQNAQADTQSYSSVYAKPDGLASASASTGTSAAVQRYEPNAIVYALCTVVALALVVA
ncbi:hypothetical protein RI367_004749 [Sorochytrium milnesiophthora]